MEKLKIGGFEFTGEAGRTENYIVVKGFRESDKSPAVGYLLSADLFSGAGAADRFLRDTHILAQKKHPGVHPPLAAGSYENGCFVVYPDAGAPLASFDLATKAKPKEALSIIHQVLDALLFAQSKSVEFHGFVSPECIYFNLADGKARLALFGIAAAAGMSGRLDNFKGYMPTPVTYGEGPTTVESPAVKDDVPDDGTPATQTTPESDVYPSFSVAVISSDDSEVEAGSAEVAAEAEAVSWVLGPQTDLYGLGLVMLELLTGEKESELLGLEERASGDKLAAYLSGLEFIPLPVQEVLYRFLSPDAEGRYRDYKHASEDIGALLGEDTGKIAFESFIFSTLFGGKYKVGKQVAQSAYARIYRGEDTASGDHCLLKIIDLRLFPVLAEYFRVYLKQMATLEDANLVKVYDVGVHYDFGYVAMRDAGQSLEDLLVRRGLLPLHDAAHIASQIARALDFVYFSNIPVYGGIKPTNVFLSANLREVQVSDVFLARLAYEKGNLANTSAEYMSHDWAKKKEFTRPSDYYCLGLLFFELLVGHPPYSFKVEDEIIRDHLEGDTIRAVQDALISLEAKQIIMRLLDKNPGAQYKRPEEIRADIAAMMGWDKKEKIEIPHVRFDFAEVSAVGKNTKEKVEETFSYRLPTKGDRPRGFLSLLHGQGGELGDASGAVRVALEIVKASIFSPGQDPENPAALLASDPEEYIRRMLSKVNRDVYRFAFRKGKLKQTGVSITCGFIQSNTMYLVRTGEESVYYFMKGEYGEFQNVKGAVADTRVVSSSDSSLEEEEADILGFAERFRVQSVKKRLREGEQVIFLSRTLREKFSVAEIREFITSHDNPAISVELIDKNARRRRIEGTISAVLVNFGDVTKFIEEAAHRTTGNLARSYMESADQLLRDGKVDDAIAVYQRAIDHNPNYTILHFRLGKAFAAKGLDERAIGSFMAAIDLDNRHIPAHLESARIYMAIKKYGQAHELLVRIIARGVEDADLFATMGAVCNRMRRFREATDCCQKALLIQPGHPVATQEMLTANRAKWFAK